MKRKRSTYSRLYQAALRRYLKLGPAASLQPALRLGRQAVNLRLKTLDLALIHEEALIAQVLPVGASTARGQIIKRARTFFARAILPIEETHRSAMETVVHLSRLNQELSQRTLDLAASNQQLKKEVARRLVVEETLRKSEQHSSRLLGQSKLLQQQLQHLSRRILSVQEDERKRISRELHDVIAQMLTGINLQLASLKMEATDNIKGISRKIAITQRLVERSVDIVHQFARELRPAVLDDLGLIPALHSFMNDFSKETGIRVGLTAFAGVEKLSSGGRTVLYRVAHEALTNVARHAQAARVDVNIQRLPAAISMNISDNGKGFELNRVLFADNPRRLGLLGIRERVEMIGGKFAVESEPGRGTTIHAQLPFKNGTKENTNP